MIWLVSIQPKPKKGLVETLLSPGKHVINSFNPAEAEEGFSRDKRLFHKCKINNRFNPAEAEEGFSRKAYDYFKQYA